MLLRRKTALIIALIFFISSFSLSLSACASPLDVFDKEKKNKNVGLDKDGGQEEGKKKKEAGDERETSLNEESADEGEDSNSPKKPHTKELEEDLLPEAKKPKKAKAKTACDFLLPFPESGYVDYRVFSSLSARNLMKDTKAEDRDFAINKYSYVRDYIRFADAASKACFADLKASGSDENMIFSPISLWLPLLALSRAAGGKAQEELAKAVFAHSERLPEQRDLFAVNDLLYGMLNEPVMIDAHGSTNILSMMALEKGHTWNPQLLDDFDFLKIFCSSISAKEAEAASEELNAIVAKFTEGAIGEFSSPENFAPDFGLSLVNSVYFNATWKKTAEKSNTKTAIFHGSKGDTEVNMMEFKHDEFRSLHTNFADIVEMKYISTGARNCLLILPTEGTEVADALSMALNTIRKSVAATQNKMKSNEVKNLVGQESIFLGDLQRSEGIVRLPRMQIEQEIDLMPVLRSMGVNEIFDGKEGPPLPKLTMEENDIKMKALAQKSKLRIDEEGTMIVSVTYNLASGGPDDDILRIDLTFDRPFAFILLGGDLPLYTGIISNVAKAE